MGEQKSDEEGKNMRQVLIAIRERSTVSQDLIVRVHGSLRVYVYEDAYFRISRI